jgi:hypothetical protein
LGVAFLQQAERQALANESYQQAEQVCYQNHLSMRNFLLMKLGHLSRTFKRAIRFDVHRAEPANFRVGQRQRPRNEGAKTRGPVSSDSGRRSFSITPPNVAGDFVPEDLLTS